MDSITLLRASELQRVVEDRLEAAVDRIAHAAAEHAAKLPPKQWLTNAETQTYLGLSRATLARYRASGRLAYSKVGQRVFYRRQDVEALLERNVAAPRDRVAPSAEGRRG